MPPLPQPDFLHPRPGPGALAWLWCATGLAVLATAAAGVHADWQATRSLSARGAPAAAPPRAVLPDPAGLSRDAEARLWLRRLAHPWPAVWGAAELAPPGVRWQSFDAGQDTPLRLVGHVAVPGAAEPVAWQAAEALRAQRWQDRAVWAEVRVTTLQRRDDGLHFELLAGPAGAAGAGVAP